MSLPKIPSVGGFHPVVIVGGLAISYLLVKSLKDAALGKSENSGDGGLGRAIGENIGGGAAAVVTGAAAAATNEIVQGGAAVFGVPRTDTAESRSECELAKKSGDKMNIAIYCPAGDFFKSFF
jgi:hypothetical protein